MTTNDCSSRVRTLNRSECDDRLATGHVGRVGFTDGALPQIRPVNYAMDGSAIVFRTEENGRLSTACRDAVVAFEVDGFDELDQRGWSVQVVGGAAAVEDESEIVRVRQLSFAPWAGGERDLFIRISPGIVTGRAVG